MNNAQLGKDALPGRTGPLRPNWGLTRLQNRKVDVPLRDVDMALSVKARADPCVFIVISPGVPRCRFSSRDQEYLHYYTDIPCGVLPYYDTTFMGHATVRLAWDSPD